MKVTLVQYASPASGERTEKTFSCKENGSRNTSQEIPRPKILIVEDEMLVAASTEIALTNLGYQVTSVVASGREAIERIEKEKPDVVLMDIVLEGDMDGIEAASRIYSLYRIPFIFLTAYADENTRQRAEATNPYGYITKPFRDRELDRVIQETLLRHRNEKEE